MLVNVDSSPDHTTIGGGVVPTSASSSSPIRFHDPLSRISTPRVKVVSESNRASDQGLDTAFSDSKED